jgi:hypothetical protein
VEEFIMPRGDKSKYTQKQIRQAKDIEKGYEVKGVAKKVAERIAWATVNKTSGGGKKSGSGRQAMKKTQSRMEMKKSKQGKKAA